MKKFLQKHSQAAWLFVAALPSAVGAQTQVPPTSPPVQVAPAPVFGIEEAFTAALAFDPKFRSAQRDFEASREYRIQGRSLLLPSVAFIAARGRNLLDQRSQVQTPVGPRTDTRRLLYNSASNVLQLRQPLINFDALARYRQAELQSLYGEVVLSARSQDLILRLSEAYTTVLLAQDQVRLARAQVEALSEQYAASEKLLTRGEGTRTDVLESRSGLQLAQAQVIEAEAALQNAMATLSGIVGPSMTRMPTVDLAGFEPIELKLAELGEWEAAAQRLSVDIAARRLQVEIAKQDLKRAEAGHLPQLDLQASISKNSSDSVNTVLSDNYQRSIGVQLTVPLYQGGLVSSQVRQQVANVGKAEADLDDATQNVLVELRKQFNILQSGAKRIEALESAAASAQLQIEATRKSVAGGVRINLDVLRAQQQASSVARDLSNARFTYLLAWLRLRSSTGLLSPEDLGEVAAQLRQTTTAAAAASGRPAY
ncbi:TolC family outer membrane protein [uncultured Xylophilus sp.]|uniref:TolC family outer membrane protein n=1 Tax=uncultured Xylophilus sp. TaxID=296832 RepID=UPI0025D8602B|nr:TolC family outer membrane protein [uncultured Xylophilus sp.]